MAISFENARRYHVNTIARIKQAATLRQPPELKKLIRRYLHSTPAKHYAAYRVLGCTQHLQQLQDESIVLRTVRGMNLFQRNLEPVRWWRLEKRRGRNDERRFRPLCSLGNCLKAQHLMIRDVLLAALQPEEHVYDWKGRGRDREVQEILAALVAGNVHAYVGDIVSSYDSFSSEALFGLPLPKDVVQWNLIPENLRMIHSREREKESVQAVPISPERGGASWVGPRGLIQGSPASNVIQAWAFREAHTVIPRNCRLFVLSDNVVLLCRTEDDCASGADTLRAHFASNRAGPFNLVGDTFVGDTFGPGQSFSHMGYEFFRGIINPQPTISFDPSRYEAMVRRIVDRVLERCDGQPINPGMVSEVIERAKSGYRSLSEPDDQWMVVEMAVMEEIGERLGLS